LVIIVEKMPTDDSKQMLTVSSPCLLLNHIAQRYTRTSRIIMEYVDNSLDDCEVLFDEESNSYSRPIEVNVRIDRQKSKKASEVDPAANAAQVAVPSSEKADESQNAPAAAAQRKKKTRKDEDKVTVTCSDNCRGMTKAILSRLVVNVGESNKRASKFTNGQFGFGVHAFRAAASRIEFKTKAQGAARTLFLAINRKSEYFPHPKPVKDEANKGIKTESGTEVTVSGFDNTWSEQLDPVEIIKEIEHHFSGLLERENLKVLVTDVAKDKTVECQPFSFAQGTTRRIVKDLKVTTEDELEAVLRVRLYISSKPKHNKNCMFVCKGRRINEISDVKSFMKMSRCRWAVWGHPNLVGYVDVSGILEPVITRDEFILNKTRKDVYRKIIDEIEGDLYKKLHEVNENRRVMALAKLEDVVSRCVNVAVKKDSKRSKEGISYLEQLMMAKKPIRRRKIDEDFDVLDDQTSTSRKRKRLEDDDNKDEAKKEDVDENPAKKRKNRGLGFNIAFVKELVDEERGIPLRARLVGEDVQINMKHPDFLQRIKVSKAESQPIVTERLCGYLANIIATAYKSHTLLRGGGIDKYKEDHTLLLDEILDVTFSLEGQLRSKLKLMQREMDAGTSMMRPMGPPPAVEA